MRDDNSRSGPSDPTRREFLVNTGGAAAASVIGAYLPVDAHGEAGQSGSETGIRIRELPVKIEDLLA